MARSCWPIDQKYRALNVKTRASRVGSFSVVAMTSASLSSSKLRRNSPSGDSEVRKLNRRSNACFMTASFCGKWSTAVSASINLAAASRWADFAAAFAPAW